MFDYLVDVSIKDYSTIYEIIISIVKYNVYIFLKLSYVHCRETYIIK